jgi:hypothetical protein
MSTIDETKALEARLVQAELGPDPAFFDEVLADDMLLGQRLKTKVVAAHQPSGSAKFTRVQMRDVEIIDHGSAAVVSCTGLYEGPRGAPTLRFMRVG